MKNILLLYTPISQKHLVDSIISHTIDDHYEITGFNVNDWTFNNGTTELPALFKYVKLLKRIKYFGQRITNRLVTLLLILLSKKFDYIDVTFFMPIYYGFLDYLIKVGKPYKITIWGSDFYRSKQKDLEKKRVYLNKAKIIQVETEVFKKDIVKVFPELESKIAVCNYGIDLLDVIDSLGNNEPLVPDAKGKIVVTCGYNATQGQQHSIIVSSLQKMQEGTKNKIFLFFPMTYGAANNNYINNIENELINTGIPFKMFRERLSDYDLAKLRLQTDIVVNVQVTDALASSLIEHLYAGGILIAGEWLPYSIFTDNGIQYIKTSLEDLSANLESAINGIEELKEVKVHNRKGAKIIASWSTRSKALKELFLNLIDNY